MHALKFYFNVCITCKASGRWGVKNAELYVSIYTAINLFIMTINYCINIFCIYTWKLGIILFSLDNLIIKCAQLIYFCKIFHIYAYIHNFSDKNHDCQVLFRALLCGRMMVIIYKSFRPSFHSFFYLSEMACLEHSFSHLGLIWLIPHSQSAFG